MGKSGVFLFNAKTVTETFSDASECFSDVMENKNEAEIRNTWGMRIVMVGSTTKNTP